MGGGQVVTSLDSNHPLRVTAQKGDTRQLSHGANPAARVDANQIGRAGGSEGGGIVCGGERGACSSC